MMNAIKIMKTVQVWMYAAMSVILELYNQNRKAATDGAAAPVLSSKYNQL